jgi:hypothetical protein
MTTQDGCTCSTGARTNRAVATILFPLAVIFLVAAAGVLTVTSSTARGTRTMNDSWFQKVMLKPNKNESNTETITNASSHIIADVADKLSTNETCVTPEMIGTWTFVDAPNFTSAVCCSPHDRYPQDHPFCNYSQNDEMVWDVREGVDFQGNTAYLPWMQGRGCGRSCQRTFRDHHVWKSPTLPLWDAKEFCRLLGPRRRVLMLGDSTMGQAAATLIAAVHGVCQTQLLYFIADTLIQEPYGLNRGSHWLDIVGNHSRTADEDIVVLTVGAHMPTMDQMINVSNVVLHQIMSMKKERPNLTIVYKTQQPGGCTNEIKNVSLPPLEVGKNFISITRNTFNHPFFYDYDNIVIRRLQELGIPFLDMRMLYSRSDAHPSSQWTVQQCRRSKYCDCLHFCSPGPLDLFAILFLHLLQNNFEVSQCV